MDPHAHALTLSAARAAARDWARSFVKEIGRAGLADVPALRETLAREARADGPDALTRQLAELRERAPALLRSLSPEATRALGLLGDLVERAPAMSDAELLEELRAFADLFTPLVFEPPRG